jgi:hypothetical protein
MEKESRATKRSRAEKFRHAYNEAQLLKHQYNSKTQQHLHRGLSSPDLGKSPNKGLADGEGKNSGPGRQVWIIQQYCTEQQTINIGHRPPRNSSLDTDVPVMTAHMNIAGLVRPQYFLRLTLSSMMFFSARTSN